MDTDYILNLFNVRDLVVVITGGGGVLCSEIARGLARAGARVALLDISEEAARAVAHEIEEAGGQALAVPCNVLDRSSLLAARALVLERWGAIDALINGAGGNRPEATTGADQSFFSLDAGAFERVLDLNLMGIVLPTQVFGEPMAQRGQGVILNIASIAAARPVTRVPAYSAAKGAVANLTQWLAVHISQEYAPGIRVNAIAPGFFLTHQNRYLLTDRETGEPTLRGRTIMGHTPQGRYGEPRELVGAVLWLLSPAGSFVHGAIIPVDGGFCACSGV
jgi:NAD(P)-dependent dehydrogenase (short-subunit alcohol dehydrogenase family)